METRDFSVLIRVGEGENGSLGLRGGAYSGMVRISNWETREMVILR